MGRNFLRTLKEDASTLGDLPAAQYDPVYRTKTFEWIVSKFENDILYYINDILYYINDILYPE